MNCEAATALGASQRKCRCAKTGGVDDEWKWRDLQDALEEDKTTPSVDTDTDYTDNPVNRFARGPSYCHKVKKNGISYFRFTTG
jgi:hypothetical protein